MSFYPGGGAGAGGGWPPPFFNQPPPNVPMQFYTADPSQAPVQGFPPGVQPEYQQGYNPYMQVPVPISGQPAPVPAPQPQPQSQVQVQQESPTQSLERDHRRAEYSPQSRDRRHSPDRSRRSRRDDDNDDPRYARRRSPVDEQMYRRRGGEERGRPKDRRRLDESPPSEKPKVDIDALLQDERLRNVLFAGISKATAKLEQSLHDDKGTSKEQSNFEPEEAKNLLFPSASTSQPRSILKRKDGSESGGAKALSNLSALERTLHMLRGKGDSTTDSAPPESRSSLERKSSPPQGALGKLSAYDEGNEDNKYLYEKEKHQREKDSSASSSTQPFWSVPSKLETSKREVDSFDVKEKMFEEWRQKIGKQSDSSSNPKSSQRETLRGEETVIHYKQGVKKRDMPSSTGAGEPDNQEELDSTVQNILQSIGFNFDLSKRMQELARKKRRQEDEGSSGITNASASFMDKGEILAEQLKASLIQSGSDLSSIDHLIKEARASSRGNRHSVRDVRSPDSDRRGSSYGRDVREISQSPPRYERRAREEYTARPKERTLDRYINIGTDQWERISPEFSPRHRQRLSQSPKRRFKERRSPSPLDAYDDRGRRAGPTKSERFRDDGDRVEYFYPEKEITESPPSVPLSFSSRKKIEDLSGGLLKSLRVENFRVMSRPSVDDQHDDSYIETRRVILPARGEQDRGRSPLRTVTRKRSASPLPMPVPKERKLSPGYVDDPYRGRSPDRRAPSIERRLSPPRRRSPSPRRRSPSPKRRERSRSPYRRRSRSRSRKRSRSPYRVKSPSYRRKSPPYRRRSPSPRRGKSPLRRKRSPPRKRTPPKWAGRSRSKEKSKPASATFFKKKPQFNKDLSKLPEKERKEELKKMLTGDSVAKADGDDEEGKTKLTKIASGVSWLTDCDQSKINTLTAQILLLSTDQQATALTNIASRKSKVLALKNDLGRLKKAQNELMRKSQRSGLGNKDPNLKANNLSQMEIEKEIDRLSTPELAITLGSNLDHTLRNIQSKLEKETEFKTKPKNQKEHVTKERASGDGSDTKASIAKAMETAGQTSWTAVDVKDEDLPEIEGAKSKDSKKKTDKEIEKKKSVSIKPKKNIYYEYVDSRNHWCSHCHAKCNAIDQYLNHLHGKKHLNVINQLPRPWMKTEDGSSKSSRKVGQAQTRRTKGSEMLYPISGFYCTICSLYCGDFMAADKHLKSDEHYDKYLGFLRDNPGYEKKILLEKSEDKNQHGNHNRNEPKTTPAPLPPSEKKEKKGKNLRAKRVEEEKDNLEAVDMELEENDNDEGVESKVPKMTGKPVNSVASILSILPEVAESNTSVEMKSNKEDEVKSLDKFLTIANDNDETSSRVTKKKNKRKNKSAKIPVIDGDQTVDLSEIPIPKPTELDAIPLPTANVTSTVKTLKEMQDEEKKTRDEEKRMMGIDVDAEEEKPLAPVKPPPSLSQADGGQSDEATEQSEEAKEITKPKRLDNLLAKVSKTSASIITQKAKPQSLSNFAGLSELEKKIQQDIKESLEKEKQKLKKQQERKEKRERKLEEKRMMGRKKKVFSDSESSSDEGTGSEEEETEKESVVASDQVINLGDISLPVDSTPENIECQPCETIVAESEVKLEGQDVDGVKEEIADESNQTLKDTVEQNVKEENIETQPCKTNVTESGTMRETKDDLKEEFVDESKESHEEDTNVSKEDNKKEITDVKMEVEDVADSAVSMDVDNAVTEDLAATETERNGEVVKVSTGATMESIGQEDGTKLDEKMDIKSLVEVQMETKSSVDRIDSNESAPTSTVEEGKDAEKSSDVLPSSDAKLTSVQGIAKPSSITPKGAAKMKKNLKKTAVVRALQSESDLLGVLYSSPETLAKGNHKKGAKKAVAKRGGKAGARPARKAVQISSEEKEADFSMDDFVVLSEVAEEDEDMLTQEDKTIDEDVKDVQQNAVSDDSVQKNEDESSKTQESSNEQKEDDTEAIKAVVAEPIRGGKSGTRGRGRGKRGAVKKEPVVHIPLSDEQKDDDENTGVEEKEAQSTELKDTVDDVTTSAIVEEKEEAVVSRTRRGRSAAATTKTPAKTTGRQTRNKGKKNAIEDESPVSKEEITDKIVDESEANISEENNENNLVEDMPTLQPESDVKATESDSEKGKTNSTEPKARATRSKQGKNANVAVVVANVALENIEIQGEVVRKEKNMDEGVPSLHSFEQDKEGDDSDATVTEDTEDPSSMDQPGDVSSELMSMSYQNAEPVIPLPSSSQPRDPPMSGVVSEILESTDNMEMALGGEEAPITTDGSEFESLPTAGLSLGLEGDTDSMDFPESMAGFTVVDVEGRPDDDGGGDYDDGKDDLKME